MSKLDQLAEVTGKEVHELLEEATYDSMAEGICTNPGCDFTVEVEPDCHYGYCDNCGSRTVQSCLVLAGMV